MILWRHQPPVFSIPIPVQLVNRIRFFIHGCERIAPVTHRESKRVKAQSRAGRAPYRLTSADCPRPQPQQQPVNWLSVWRGFPVRSWKECGVRFCVHAWQVLLRSLVATKETTNLPCMCCFGADATPYFIELQRGFEGRPQGPSL